MQVVQYSAKVIWIWICVNYSVWKPHFHDMFRRGSRLSLSLFVSSFFLFPSFFSPSLFVFLLLLCLTHSVFSVNPTLLLIWTVSVFSTHIVQIHIAIQKSQTHFYHLSTGQRKVRILESFFTAASRYSVWIKRFISNTKISLYRIKYNPVLLHHDGNSAVWNSGEDIVSLRCINVHYNFLSSFLWVHFFYGELFWWKKLFIFVPCFIIWKHHKILRWKPILLFFVYLKFIFCTSDIRIWMNGLIVISDRTLIYILCISLIKLISTNVKTGQKQLNSDYICATDIINRAKWKRKQLTFLFRLKL